MKHMNLQPLDSHGVDFSRVRMWNLNNWARHYRQTLVFSSIQDPQINSILSKHCANYRGQVLHCARDLTDELMLTKLAIAFSGEGQRSSPTNIWKMKPRIIGVSF